MYLNQFSVRIPEGAERTSGYVEIKHGQQYTLVLRNSRNVRCDAKVEIDGKEIGTFRINANDSIRLERPLDDNGRFTFYKAGSSEARKSGLDRVSRNDLGLISVTFTPEKSPVTYVHYYYEPFINVVQDAVFDNYVTSNSASGSGSCTASWNNDRAINCSYSAGGTGLSGESNQSFIHVDGLNYDYSQQTTIHLRLVLGRKDEPRELKPIMSENIVPPPIG